ncbi:hypothetical protein GQ600_23587 [Phytophthora cactorum]|nr:hypothetical protein GQ600_23587 [Phytophthora cactorum]
MLTDFKITKVDGEGMLVPFGWPHREEKDLITRAGIKGLFEPEAKWLQTNELTVPFYHVRAGTDRFAGPGAEVVVRQWRMRYARNISIDWK